MEAPQPKPSQASMFTWKIENFSRLNTKKLYSEVFVVGDYKWRLLIFPKGNNVEHLSVYLDVADSETLPYGWSIDVQLSLTVVSQIHSKFTVKRATQHKFNARESDWGFTSFLALGDLHDPSKGFLVNDTCVIEADVAVPKVIDCDDNNDEDQIIPPARATPIIQSPGKIRKHQGNPLLIVESTDGIESTPQPSMSAEVVHNGLEAESRPPKLKAVSETSGSVYHPGRMSSAIIRNAIQRMGEDILKDLKNAPLHHVPSVHKEALAVYQSIEKLDGDPSLLQQIVNSYVSTVNAYLKLQEQVTGCFALSEIKTKRAEATKQLKSAKSDLLLAEQEHDTCVQTLTDIQKKRTSLEMELCSLQEKETKLGEDLQAKAAAIETARLEVESAEKLVHDIDVTPIFTPEDAKAVEDLKKDAMNSQKSLDPSGWMDRDV